MLFFLAIRCCLYEISRIGKFIQKHTNGGQGPVGGERPDILMGLSFYRLVKIFWNQ